MNCCGLILPHVFRDNVAELTIFPPAIYSAAVWQVVVHRQFVFADKIGGIDQAVQCRNNREPMAIGIDSSCVERRRPVKVAVVPADWQACLGLRDRCRDQERYAD